MGGEGEGLARSGARRGRIKRCTIFSDRISVMKGWKRVGGNPLAVRSDLFVRIAFAVFDSRLKVLDALAQALAEISQFARSKNQERHGEKQQDFRQTQFARHALPPMGLALRWWSAPVP